MKSAVVTVRGLIKRYDDVTAVNGIDLEIVQGEIFALLGPNGAGKSTTIEILEGFRTRDAGEVSVLGIDPAITGEKAQELRNRIGIVAQNSGDAGDLSVYECISHFSHYYSKPRNPEEVIAAVGLIEKRKSLIRNLSGGQRRRLDVALGIIGSPELLFLDEPTTGFDPQARRHFWELVRGLRDGGTTIVLTTHYLDEAEALADRVGVINHGVIVEIAHPTTLGGRAKALAQVRWREAGETKVEQTLEPTKFVAQLSARLGEVPELEVIRPSLEDIYLHMIGEKQ